MLILEIALSVKHDLTLVCKSMFVHENRFFSSSNFYKLFRDFKITTNEQVRKFQNVIVSGVLKDVKFDVLKNEKSI